MNRLTRFLVLTAVSLVLRLYVTPAGFAQATGTGGKTTVTGCLQKGDEANEFSITGEDGKTYGLRSSAVDLSKHLGHKVTVTGTLKAESYEKEKGESEEHEKKGVAEAGDIRVTNLKMVSDTCK
jgi:UDP-N-acetylmuramyl tripeptide synthase